MRGPHGHGIANDAGKDRAAGIFFMYEATVYNTWFKKLDIQKQTWQHPKSKYWHCIDYTIMRQKDHGRCLDATVKRGVECKDHQLLCVEDKMGRKHYHQRKSSY